MKTKLRRCPFCNGHDLTLEVTASLAWVRCMECTATGPHAYQDDAKAIEYWNRGYEPEDCILGGKNNNRNEEMEIDL